MKYGLSDEEYAWNEKFNNTPIVKLSHRDIEKHLKLLDKMIKYLGNKLNVQKDYAMDASPEAFTYSETGNA